MIRTPYGLGPAVASGVRGGAKVSSTVPVVPGNSRSVGGSTVCPGGDGADRFEAVLVDDVTGVAQTQPHRACCCRDRPWRTRVPGRSKGSPGQVSATAAIGSWGPGAAAVVRQGRPACPIGHQAPHGHGDLPPGLPRRSFRVGSALASRWTTATTPMWGFVCATRNQSSDTDKRDTAGARGSRKSRGARTAGPVPVIAMNHAVASRSPRAVLALQRAAGNAAVVQLVEQERHVHDGGCGHQQGEGHPVQRAGVDQVLRSSGTPICLPGASGHGGPARRRLQRRAPAQ